MDHAYKTIKAEAEGLYKEKGSKFIARAFPVNSIEEVHSILETLRKEYYDARHHCYAYILKPDGSHYRANDDGEPNHSAGDPILGQIKSKELTNTLIVVIRYFGGTKLGVSGLINAYRTAAAEALSRTEILELEVMRLVEFHFTYPYTNEVMKLVDSYQVKIDNQLYEADCIIKGRIPVRYFESLCTDVEMLFNTGSEISLKFD